jgi:carbon-monoxide dehydrogenase small subunit
MQLHLENINDMANITLTVNGKIQSHEVEDRTLLVNYLRETLRLTGTHVGCDTSQCGACTVSLNGDSVKSCTILAAQVSGGAVTTVEGLAQGGCLHPVQDAFVQCHGLQCGFCTPGMIMSVEHFLRREADAGLGDEAIHRALEGNICRCTGYVNIIEAVRHAAAVMQTGDSKANDAGARA